MTDARKALDRIKARVPEDADAHTSLATCHACQDCANLVDYSVPRLTKALEAVLSGHKPDEDGECVECSNYEHIVPVAVDYPCLLVQIITNVLTEEDK